MAPPLIPAPRTPADDAPAATLPRPRHTPDAAVLAVDNNRFMTAYCAACGGWYPIGHGCQGGAS
ncbi:hypothetical protein ACFY1Q_30900 [Streptomyces albidoflavus]